MSERAKEPVRVLVVEDAPEARAGLVRLLRAHGYAVTEAADGEEARSKLAAVDPDVVLSDIGLPRLGGIELLREVRAHDLDLPVILLTGAPSLETAIGAIEFGAFQYHVKPIRPEVLLKSLEQAAQLRRFAQIRRDALELMGKPSAPGDRAGLETAFDAALDALWMAFQPIVRAEDLSVYGYEVLMRSNEPALPHPGAVLDAAERLDRVLELGRVVRARAVEAWGKEPGILFVNLHPAELMDDALLDPGAPLSGVADQVVLEVTERAALTDLRAVTERVAALRERGFRVAIDDLGAGYASLNSFVYLSPELVKIDMGLVRGCDGDPVRRRLIGSVVALCEEMGVQVVAEGVETVPERDALRELGCHLLQGYLLARPGPPFPEVSRD